MNSAEAVTGLLSAAVIRTERINDPADIDAARIEQLIASGVRPIVQFSEPEIAPGLLDAVNALCARHGDALDVRFYGFYSRSFDCRLLRRVPAVSSLLVDCLQHAENVDELRSLEHLTALSLGIFDLDAPDLLADPAFKRLHRLSLSPTKRNNLSLRPVAGMGSLEELHTSQATHLDAVGECSGLRGLSLGGIGKKVGLDFVGRLRRLETLRLILGGREDLGELSLENLPTLEIIRVLGFRALHPERFPALETLQIEDEIRLTSLAFPGHNPRLSRLLLLNCKSLAELRGLEQLEALRDLRISRTAVDLDEILARGLPRTLKTFGFYTGRKTSDAAIRKRLDALGYSEFG